MSAPVLASLRLLFKNSRKDLNPDSLSSSLVTAAFFLPSFPTK